MNRLAESPLHVANVVRVNHDRCILAVGDSYLEVQTHPEGRVGSTVLLLEETKQIFKALPQLGVGITATVRTVYPGFVEIQDGTESYRVVNPIEGVEVGHKVLLDRSTSVVLENFGAEKAFVLQSDTGVSWDDIGGLEEVKKLLIEAIENPVKHAALHKAYGKKRIKGILLHGASGCGKTMLGKAAATSLRKIHGGAGADTNFIYVKGPAILNMYVGNSEGNIRDLFTRGRAHFKKHGYPAILFIDEADALLRTRERHSVSGMESTIVPQFLSEMDGLEDSGVMVILSTNLPRELDAAVVREGRIDRKIKVTRPVLKEGVEIFAKALKGKPLAEGGDVVDFAVEAARELYKPSRAFYEVVMKTGGSTKVALGDLCNGAMITAVVEEASSIALRRDEKSGTVTGLRKEDLMHAVDFIDAQNRDMDHERDLQELLGDMQPHIEEIRKARGERYVQSNGKARQEEGQAVPAVAS